MTYWVHYEQPLTFGTVDHLLPTPDSPIVPRVDRVRARRPKTPGLPAEMHLSLDVLSGLQYVMPAFEDRTIVITGGEVLTDPDEDEDTPIDESRVVGGMLQGIDPLYAMVLYGALALGTLFLPITSGVRYALLWSVLTALGALFSVVDGPQAPPVRSGEIVWGFGAGFIIALPLLILAPVGLATTTRNIFPGVEAGSIFAYLAFAAPTAETLFFRRTIQDSSGFTIAVIGSGLNTLLLFWPDLLAAGAVTFAVLVGVFFTAMAVMYSFIRERYGLPAALVCQVTVNVTLLVLPVLLIAERIP